MSVVNFAYRFVRTAQTYFPGLLAVKYAAQWRVRQFRRRPFEPEFALLGRVDEALDVLDDRFGYRGSMPGQFRVTLEDNIAFDNIREHPRFKALVAATKADRAQQLENVRQMEANGEIMSIEELRAMQD